MNKIFYSMFIAVSVVMVFGAVYHFSTENTNNTVVVTQDSINFHKKIPITPENIAENQLLIPKEPDVDLEEIKEQHCLALAIYGEARGETAEGMEWVAWVVKNRAQTRDLHICDVILQPYQFEAFRKGTELRRLVQETKKGEITFPRMNNKWVQNKIHQIAEQVHQNQKDPTGGATHFWAPQAQALLGRNPPSWSDKLTFIRMAGNHRFYKQS